MEGGKDGRWKDGRIECWRIDCNLRILRISQPSGLPTVLIQSSNLPIFQSFGVQSIHCSPCSFIFRRRNTAELRMSVMPVAGSGPSSMEIHPQKLTLWRIEKIWS